MKNWRLIFGLVGVVGAVACDPAEVLDVPNKNDPDTERVLTTPADVESVIGTSFNIIHTGHFGPGFGQWPQMMVMGLENASSLANFSMGPRFGIPRVPIGNQRGRQNAEVDFRDFQFMQRAARSASTGLFRLNQAGFTLGSTGRDLRARAFAHFVIGVAQGDVALGYDSAAIINERISTDLASIPLAGADQVMAAAIAALDSAVAVAGRATGANAFVLETNWINGRVNFSQDSLARLARSYRARFRAQVARDSTTRKSSTNWAAVIADATNGMPWDMKVDLSPGAGWANSWFNQHRVFDNWHQLPYFFIGWADTSGGYANWLATPLSQRNLAKFLIHTPDKRFPAGATRAAQVIASNLGQKNSIPRAGIYIHNRDPGEDDATEPYGESFYEYARYISLFLANVTGPWAFLTKAELDMLAAEGHLRTGNAAAAITLINTYRTRNGLLPIPVGTAVDGVVPGGLTCVPRVPTSSGTSTRCGTIFEAMKYEKRLETMYSGWSMWYMDGRGWGDLPVGTAVHYPVPQQEMDTRAKPFYDLGGEGLPGGAPRGNYGF